MWGSLSGYTVRDDSRIGSVHHPPFPPLFGHQRRIQCKVAQIAEEAGSAANGNSDAVESQPNIGERYKCCRRMHP